MHVEMLLCHQATDIYTTASLLLVSLTLAMDDEISRFTGIMILPV